MSATRLLVWMMIVRFEQKQMAGYLKSKLVYMILAVCMSAGLAANVYAGFLRLDTFLDMTPANILFAAVLIFLYCILDFRRGTRIAGLIVAVVADFGMIIYSHFAKGNASEAPIGLIYYILITVVVTFATYLCMKKRILTVIWSLIGLLAICANAFLKYPVKTWGLIAFVLAAGLAFVCRDNLKACGLVVGAFALALAVVVLVLVPLKLPTRESSLQDKLIQSELMQSLGVVQTETVVLPANEEQIMEPEESDSYEEVEELQGDYVEEPDADDDSESDVEERSWNKVLVILSVAFSLAIACLVILIAGKGYSRKKWEKAVSRLDNRSFTVNMFDSILMRLAKFGYVKSPDTTYREYAAVYALEFPEIVGLTQIYERVVYGGGDVSIEERRRFEEFYEELGKRLKEKKGLFKYVRKAPFLAVLVLIGVSLVACRPSPALVMTVYEQPEPVLEEPEQPEVEEPEVEEPAAEEPENEEPEAEEPEDEEPEAEEPEDEEPEAEEPEDEEPEAEEPETEEPETEDPESEKPETAESKTEASEATGAENPEAPDASENEEQGTDKSETPESEDSDGSSITITEGAATVVELPENIETITACGAAAQLSFMLGNVQVLGSNRNLISIVGLLTDQFSGVNAWWDGDGDSSISDESFAELLEAKPDVCFGVKGQKLFTKAQKAKLAENGICYIALSPFNSVKNIKKNAKILGKIFGNTKLARKYCKWVDNLMTDVQSRCEGEPAYTTYVGTGANEELLVNLLQMANVELKEPVEGNAVTDTVISEKKSVSVGGSARVCVLPSGLGGFAYGSTESPLLAVWAAKEFRDAYEEQELMDITMDFYDEFFDAEINDIVLGVIYKKLQL